MTPYEERLCRTCKYGKKPEYHKPCVVYRDDCQLYEPIEEMTRVEQTIANLKKLKSFHNGSYGADIDRAIKALEQQTRWIPVSEKPQEGRYLCTYEHWYGKCIDFGSFDGESWYIKPIAYMPLPEPYKAESEE